MKRLLSTLFTLLFSSLALADNSIDPAPNTDLSITYLGQIFGTVGNVLHGTAGDMLGQMFYKFNQGIFIVAGMFVAYTTTTMVLRSAAEGSFMGPDKKSGWFTILRIPLGLALLIPVPATGYETYQSVVMEAVVQGVNLADTTWNWALDYLHAGGVVYMPPALSSQSAGYTGPKDTPTATNYTGELNMALQVLAMATCMEIGNLEIASSNTPTPPGQQNPSAYSSYAYQVDNTGYNIMYPGAPGNTPGAPVTVSTAQCGAINWNINTSPSSSKTVCPVANGGTTTNTASEPDGGIACSLAQAAVQQVVNDVAEVAKQYACYFSSYGSSSESCAAYGQIDYTLLTSVGATAVLNAMVDYQNLLMPLSNINSQNAVAAYQDFIKNAQADGWIMAGRYYWDISLLNDQYTNAGGALSMPSFPQSIVTNDSNVKVAAEAIVPVSGRSSDLTVAVQGQFNTFYENQSKNSSQVQSNATINGPSMNSLGVAAQFLNSFVGPMLSLFDLFKTANLNPIIFIHQLGANLLSVAGDLWLTMTGIIFTAYLVGFICSGQSPVGPAIEGVFDWIKPILLVVITALFGVGLVLAYYVPLYPYIIFTFGTVGWFIAVIEAMVAAPLVCFGLTHPEGHDFLGRAEQALMLLLGVFLRPVLMIIGLISAMILSYVALLLLNTGYGGIITSLYANPGSDSNMQSIFSAAGAVASAQATQVHTIGGEVVMGIVVVPTLLAIFAMLVYTIIQQCYSLIFVLPENILTWVGGPKTDSHAAQYAQQIESGVQSMGKAYGEGTGAAAGITPGSLKDAMAKRFNKPDSGKSKDKPEDKPEPPTDGPAPSSGSAGSTGAAAGGGGGAAAGGAAAAG